MLPTPLLAAVAGLALGLAYNPLAALLGATAAAAVCGFPGAGRVRTAWAGAIVAVAWLLGDRFAVMVRLRLALDAEPLLTSAPVAATFAVLALWATVGLGVGFVLPAWVGAFVGRRVRRGRGWLSAGAVAAALSLALSVVAAVTSGALAPIARG